LQFIFVVMLASFHSKNTLEAGCDEAGRGCLAGPVFASAVILTPDYFHEDLNDSKQLSRKKRERLRIEIEANAIAWAIGIADNNEIDEINILNASYLAMHRAIEQLKPRPQLLLVDGNRFNPYPGINHLCIVKGDATFASIAAASILAKEYRDEFMRTLAVMHPEYIWDRNVGYPTEEHRNAIRSVGITPFHRKTFQLLPAQFELFE